VLVETGFLTNPTESRRLKSGAYQQRLALGIVRGVAAVVPR
jgi:N-acetylmuramoyl-L-alanine amidase